MRKAGMILVIAAGVLFVSEYICAEQTGTEAAAKQQTAEPNLLQDANQVVMIFDGKVLTLKQVVFLGGGSDYRIIENIAGFWLDTQLLYEEAVRRGVDRDEKAKFIADIDYKRAIAAELTAEVRNDVKVTDEEVRKYYEESKETDLSLKEPMYLSFSHITVKTLKEAEAVLRRINAGEDINELAREISVASDAKRGGKANRYQERTIISRFGQEFLSALLNVTEGQLIGPVKNKDGRYEVARHEGKRAARIKDFEEARGMIRTKLERQVKEKAVSDLMNDLREKSRQRYKKAGILSEKNN